MIAAPEAEGGPAEAGCFPALRCRCQTLHLPTARQVQLAVGAGAEAPPRHRRRKCSHPPQFPLACASSSCRPPLALPPLPPAGSLRTDEGAAVCCSERTDRWGGLQPVHGWGRAAVCCSLRTDGQGSGVLHGGGKQESNI